MSSDRSGYEWREKAINFIPRGLRGAEDQVDVSKVVQVELGKSGHGPIDASPRDQVLQLA